MPIRVLPANPDMLRLLRHPNGQGFTSMTNPAEWPADQFTFRRIGEGAIKKFGAPALKAPAAKAPVQKKSSPAKSRK